MHILEEGYLKLGAAIEHAAESLPGWFWIQLDVERGSGKVRLYEGMVEIDFPTNHESFSEQICDAVGHAQNLHKKKRDISR